MSFIQYDGHSFNVEYAKTVKKKQFVAQHKHFYSHLPESEREAAISRAYDVITGQPEQVAEPPKEEESKPNE